MYVHIYKHIHSEGERQRGGETGIEIKTVSHIFQGKPKMIYSQKQP